MSNTPSDAEIEKLAAEHLKAFAQFTGAGDVWVEGEVAFARAVLAKWGTPQQEAQEPVAYVHVPHYTVEGKVRPVVSFEKYQQDYDDGIYSTRIPLYTAPQPTPTAQAANSVQEDAALWHWLAEYLVGTRTDLDDEIVASETVNDLRKLVEAAIKQGEKQ